MSNRYLRMIFQADDQTGDTFNNVSMAIIGLNQALELAAKALEAVKKGFEFANEGAQLQLTETRFDRLAKSIGTTSHALSRDLDDALGGTLSKMDAMALATDMMSLGLAKTEEEARNGKTAGNTYLYPGNKL